MSDMGPAQGIDPASHGQQREADLQAILDALNGPNPCWGVMSLPQALASDGAGS